MGKTITTAYLDKKINGIVINTSKKCHSSNYTNDGSRTVNYIVMHYTGNSKDTASANANYFTGANRQASAHFFVDDTNIYQSVEMRDVAWHCGTSGTYYHSSCRNSNSIGIEMCCTAGNYKISTQTIMNAAKLCAELCKTLGIKEADVDKYVLRHYDITHKKCPAQMANSSDDPDWKAFKAQVKGYLDEGSLENTAKNEEIYRVRKSWSDAKSQKGAYVSLENAKKACDKAGEGYEVYNSKGKAVYPEPKKEEAIPAATGYKVKITIDALKIRKGPGTQYKQIGAITDRGIYTIVKKKGNWGLLKAGPQPGNSWIHLGYTKRV